ncbi:hypothetical protein KP509_20G014100 [Ceratopteris richardii]|uniref:Ternary complex factor MIP1 leucine-zipper domain-containing protein n=2 Tax=Ceratopteris richardii TaxID=49495 RepID=A0A8T2SFD7_CERRI|nr:hypothetical protein KP509_20G014100 [Ceratopteris richardii]
MTVRSQVSYQTVEGLICGTHDTDEKISMQSWNHKPVNPRRKNTSDQKSNLLNAAERAFQRRVRQEYRNSLEKDVSILRRKLKKEIDTQKALERAFKRTLGVLPRFSPGLPSEVRQLLAEVAVLEEEVISLEECIVALRQELYNEAVHLASSKSSTALSPCLELPADVNTDFLKHESPIRQSGSKSRRDSVISKLLPPPVESRSKECTPKVQLAREEKLTKVVPQAPEKVKSQKPLFASSKQRCSNVLEVPEGMATPKAAALVSNGGKNFKIQEKNGTEKENLSQVTDRMKTMRLQEDGISVATTVKKNSVKSPSEISSRFTQNQKAVEPNLLSEEMVWCLSSVFLRLTRQSSMLDCETASTMSRSTVSSIWSFTSRNSISNNPSTDVTEEIELVDPYRICGSFTSVHVGPYQYYQEVTASSIDYSKIPKSAFLLKKLMCLVEKLRSVDLKGLTHQQKLSFWINIYNACIMHGFLEHGIPDNPNQVVSLMGKAVINVGGHVLSALAIEHFILRLPCDGIEDVWKNRNKDKEGWMRSTYGLEWPEPLVSFALCCGSWSSPAVSAKLISFKYCPWIKRGYATP